MYKIKIPALAVKNVEVIANNRDEAIKKAYFLIEENNSVDIKWVFVKNIHDSIKMHNVIPRQLYINEEDLLNNNIRYLISVPCTGYASLDVEAKNEVEAINKAIFYLKFNKNDVLNIKAHENIDFNDSNILMNATVN